MLLTSYRLLQWRKVIWIITFFVTFISGCVGEADSTPAASINADGESQQIIPSTIPSATSNEAISSTSDVISIPSPTFQSRALTSTQTVSDTISFLSQTSSPIPTPSPTISSILATSFLESPLITPTPIENSPPTTTTANVIRSLLEKEMFNAINTERIAHDLPPYQADGQLVVLAQAQAQDMARRGYMSHTTPEGKTYSDRLTEIGLTPQWRGENIVLSVHPAEEAVQDALAWWLNSTPHRRNILHPEYSHLGVGVAQTSEGWYVFVLNLIKRD